LLITLKNKEGNRNGLSYPSQSDIFVCFQIEKLLNSYSCQTKTINKLLIQTQVLKHFLNDSIISSSLKTHSHSII